MKLIFIFVVFVNVTYATTTFTETKIPLRCNTYLMGNIDEPSWRGFNSMKLIELSKNGKKNKGKYFAMVDDDMYDYLNQWNWYAAVEPRTVYAKRDVYKETINGIHVYETIMMHRLVLGVTDPNLEADHIDWNGLNNQRYNLREATKAQNQSGSKKRKNCSSNYRGVTKNKYGGYTSYFCVNGKTTNLGSFKSEIEAAIVWDKKAKEVHKEFANLNFP